MSFFSKTEKKAEQFQSGELAPVGGGRHEESE
jgi:hypothetical protein